MRIVCLIENAPGPAGFRHEHGLSVYFETDRHRILADTGAGEGFVHNAALLGVDLSGVDLLFLSHGHYDHAGGIPAFAAVNPRAEIYLQKTAGLDYYGLDPEGPRYIGIDKSILTLPRLHLLEGGAMVQDSFDHEQALVIRQEGKCLLFSGCAHNGILNILDRFREEYGRDPDLVIGGFHFMKGSAYTEAELRDIEETARELAGMDTQFYTGHCTSLPGYEIMERSMGEKLHALHSGMEIPG